jgi:ankyrin repeat protein
MENHNIFSHLNFKNALVIVFISTATLLSVYLVKYYENEKRIQVFHEAVRKNDLEKVKLMIMKHSDLVYSKEKYSSATPLFDAGSKEMAELLISKGADVKAELDNGTTLLHEMACSDYRKDLIAFFISKGLDVNAKDHYLKETPLHCAAERDCVKAAELLIKEGADVNAKNFEGMTPLHYAVKKNSIKIVELLISQSVNINEKDNQGNTPYTYAINKGYTDIADLLLKHGAKE